MLDLPFQPLSALELLTTRTMTVAAGVGRKMFPAAVRTPVLVTAQCLGVARGDGAQDFPMMSRQTMFSTKVRQSASDDLT